MNMFFERLIMIRPEILVSESFERLTSYCNIVLKDFSEFLIAISITAQQEPKKKLEWAFSMYGKLVSIDLNLRFNDFLFN